MAVTSVKLLNVDAAEADDGTIEYTSVYRVLTDARTDGPRVVLAASGLPKRGDTYSNASESDGAAWCRPRQVSLELSQEESSKSWLVTCPFSAKGQSEDPQKDDKDPIDWQWHCRLDTWTRMEAPDADRNGRPLVNVCNEPFLPPPEVENPDPLIILEKNHPFINLTQWAESQGKVNSTVQWGLSTRSIKLRKWTAEPHWIAPGLMYWKSRLDLEIKFQRWFFQPPNLGFREFAGIDPATGKPMWHEIRDEFWNVLARPVALDQNGEQLPAGAAALFFDQAGGPLQKFELEDEYDFSTILPATLPGNFTLS
jgi:hypothetical protein